MKTNKPTKKAAAKPAKKASPAKASPKKASRKKNDDDDELMDEDFEEFNFDNDFKPETFKGFDDYDEDDDF